jgi:hypothetical protein
MITGPRKMFVARCKERGTTLEAVRACIVSEDGDVITVDESHPAYPGRPAPPPLLSKVKNFAVAAAKHVAAGMPMATEEEIQRRHAICMGCEFYKDHACLKCGCPINREKKYLSKLSWADSECPVGKWGKAGH